MSTQPTTTLTMLVVYIYKYLRPDGVSVDLDPISRDRARLAATELRTLLATYSEGMGTLAVTVRAYGARRVDPEYYRATDTGGQIVDPAKIRALLKAETYDLVVVLTDPDATYGTAWTGFTAGANIWARIQPRITARVVMHELGHYLERRVKAAGGTRWNDGGGSAGNAIHCAAAYGFVQNSPEWYEAYFSGLPDGTAMTPAAWNLIAREEMA